MCLLYSVYLAILDYDVVYLRLEPLILTSATIQTLLQRKQQLLNLMT